MDKLVKPGKLDWEIKKQYWFVLNENDAYELRQPGKWKLEWETENGAIIW